MPQNADQYQRQDLNRLNHEIRTAMNAIVGVTGLLASTPLDPEQAEYLESIRNGTDAVAGLLEEMSERLASPRSVRPRSLEVWDDARPEEAEATQAGSRLLLVEDNLINRRVITRLLEKLGHSVETAGNGREACEAVERTDFDLVFMDIQMPVMDGLEATRYIRAHIPSERQPWIVALTAAVLPEDREACGRAGADDYLGKPVRTEELQEAIIRAKRRETRAA
ncbi:MAG: response regulator [Rhodothermales bacterium]|nr:response regulator [Rhodothermales bacterium]MBO6780948.1 response regulator [Rhodothermales bacterium]